MPVAMRREGARPRSDAAKPAGDDAPAKGPSVAKGGCEAHDPCSGNVSGCECLIDTLGPPRMQLFRCGQQR